MNKLTKKQLLVGGLILLFAINLAALGTIIYQNYQSNQIPPGVRKIQPGDRPLPSGKGTPGRRTPGRGMGNLNPAGEQVTGRRFDHYIRQRLSLDEKQFGRYQELMEKTRGEQRTIAMELAEKRNQMMQELTREDPDSLKLENLAKEIGQLHTRLKMNTMDHFRQLRSICRPEQRDALNRLMINMSKHGPHQPGHNRPHGGRHMNRN